MITVTVNTPPAPEPTVTLTVPLSVARALLDVAGYAGDVALLLTDDTAGAGGGVSTKPRRRHVHYQDYGSTKDALCELYGPLLTAIRPHGYKAAL